MYNDSRPSSTLTPFSVSPTPHSPPPERKRSAPKLPPLPALQTDFSELAGSERKAEGIGELEAPRTSAPDTPTTPINAGTPPRDSNGNDDAVSFPKTAQVSPSSPTAPQPRSPRSPRSPRPPSKRPSSLLAPLPYPGPNVHADDRHGDRRVSSHDRGSKSIVPSPLSEVANLVDDHSEPESAFLQAGNRIISRDRERRRLRERGRVPSVLQIGNHWPQRQAVVWEGEREYHQRENEREGETFLSPGEPVSPLSPPLQSSSAKPAVINISSFPPAVQASIGNESGFRLIPSAEIGEKDAGEDVEYDKAGYVVKKKRCCGSWSWSWKKREGQRGRGAWRKGRWGWLGWAISLTVWGIVCFVAGGAIGISMR